MTKNIAVIGAGVIGLSIAYKLSQAGHHVTVFEKEKAAAQHTSSHNSGIIHAGLYYQPNSLKAKFCIEGRQMIYDFCAAHNIRAEKIGKLIVATHEVQMEKLRWVYQNAQNIGATEVQLLNGEELAELEPDVRGIAAILSPQSGMLDVKVFVEVLIAEIEKAGGQIFYEAKVEKISKDGNAYTIRSRRRDSSPSERTARERERLDEGVFDAKHRNDVSANVTTPSPNPCRVGLSPTHCVPGARDTTEQKFDAVINAAGLWAADTAQKIKDLPLSSIPPYYFAKGNYFKLSVPTPFNHLVYPLPMPGGLGIHVSYDFNETARFGPDVEWLDHLPEEPDYTVDPAREGDFRASIATYYPAILNMKLEPDYAGIRPKLVPEGEPDADFIIQDCAEFSLPNIVNLYGFESPGLTGCLAIGDYILKKIH